MSDRSNRAMQLVAQRRLDQALAEAAAACEESPGDFHCWYALGLVYRWMDRDADSLPELERAERLQPGEKSVLLAIAIAKQRLGEYAGAVAVLRRVLESDPDYVAGYNTLGMTQKLMGDPEKAAHNYDAGAKAIVRGWARGLRNAEGNPRLPHVSTRHDLWHEYAAFAAMWLAARDGIKKLAFPTGEMAMDDARRERFRGWYWQDSPVTGGTRRLFLPNFFNTVAHFLHDDGAYAHLMGNRSTVLEMLGRFDEARKHAEEAEDFMQS